ncbi:AtpZ/AtpI family protein [Thermodesulforhabdus norvegica]|uniref:Putative F0F1-ATPase subunit Ca2+/Mg2+ transporter n=1 Tax=Thermodesulforhabdus norvegica TaxID=39841 RepID=A0A1I4RJJ0_9BACT|nr:AtpZ/AtpI family protein [Thermodesulforhabdus norvegica]SFM52385.1 Putative F0F1-ATPase subunit Ca2+/Mg2+ transporter [Thermodesulforhabdus norvegica]
MSPSEDFRKKRTFIEYLALVSQLGLTMAGSILLCFAVGFFLDMWIGGGGILLALFIVLGVIGGGITVYRQIMELDRKSKK